MEGTIIIVSIIIGIAQIGLFFKLWGMCDNIIKIRDGSSLDRITASMICYMNGDMESCKKKLDESLYIAILENYYSNGGTGYLIDYENGFRRIVNDYEKRYSKFGLPMPNIERYKDPTKFLSNDVEYMPKVKNPKDETIEQLRAINDKLSKMTDMSMLKDAGEVRKADTPKNEPAAKRDIYIVDGERLTKSGEIPGNSSTLENSVSKRLKELSPDLFNSLLQEACLYHNDAKVAMEEVNKHCECLLKIPNTMNNEFIPLHTNARGTISFYNLYITHYSRNCTFDKFIFMNKGRYSKTKDNRIKVNNFLYEFGEDLKLIGVYKVK